jgi:D-amino-acid dehydrogenase
VIDDQLHGAIVALSGAIRVAGTAEFTGFDQTLRSDRIGNLTALLKQVLPEAPFDMASARPWCWLRAMSADGVPIIGHTPLSNLMVSTEGTGDVFWC